MADIGSAIKMVPFLAPAIYATDVVGIVDMIGFQSAALGIAIGPGGIPFDHANRIDVVCSDSDDGSAFAPFTDNSQPPAGTIANGVVLSLNAPQPTSTLTKIPYSGSKRFLKIRAAFVGNHSTGTPLCAFAVLGDPLVSPVLG